MNHQPKEVVTRFDFVATSFLYFIKKKALDIVCWISYIVFGIDSKKEA